MDDHDYVSLLALRPIDQLREHRAAATYARAQQVVHARAQACRQREQACQALVVSRDHAVSVLFHRLQQGRLSPGLQVFIDSAEARRRSEQQALHAERAQLARCMEEARRAAQAVAAAEERTQTRARMLEDWALDRQTALEELEDPPVLRAQRRHQRQRHDRPGW